MEFLDGVDQPSIRPPTVRVGVAAGICLADEKSVRHVAKPSYHIDVANRGKRFLIRCIFWTKP